MLKTVPLLMACTACAGGVSPYVEGGDWAVDPCDATERQLMEARADNLLGGGTRDFDLLDQYAYRVSLSDFCGHTVVITVGDMGVPESVAALDDIVSMYTDRSQSAPTLTVLTTWYRTADDETPEVGDLRRFSAKVAAEITERDADPEGLIVTDEGVLGIPVLRDPPRFGDAAIAAAAMWRASDAPEPLIRFRRETEIAGRWGVRELPFFVVLHPATSESELPNPTPRIVAFGSDPIADRIIEAAQTNPELWVDCPDGDTDSGC